MIRFYFEKLVRDKIVQNCLDDSKVIVTKYHTLDDDQYHEELIKKTTEEAEEIPNEAGSDEALEELADLQNVVDALRDQLGFSEAQVREAADRKSLKKGGFMKRHYIEYVDLDPSSEWVDNFRKQPGKYREEVIDKKS